MEAHNIIHTVDWHESEKPRLQLKVVQNLDQLLEFTSNNEVDGFLIVGDIWDRIQPFGKSVLPSKLNLDPIAMRKNMLY